jgi:GH15 family glucan-1,4-alpha-glucosidase
VTSWAACDRLARIAAQLSLDTRAAFWADRAAHMRERILREAVDPNDGHFVDAFGGGGLDASLLLLADLGFVADDDPRYVATVDAIGRALRRGGHMLRYVVADDFGLPETSFTICNFWYVEALARIGRADEARTLFEQLLARRNPLGLLSEDVHPDSGELWGNFPQTYSMVGLINAAMRLSRSWESLL